LQVHQIVDQIRRCHVRQNFFIINRENNTVLAGTRQWCQGRTMPCSACSSFFQLSGLSAPVTGPRPRPEGSEPLQGQGASRGPAPFRQAERGRARAPGRRAGPRVGATLGKRGQPRANPFREDGQGCDEARKPGLCGPPRRLRTMVRPPRHGPPDRAASQAETPPVSARAAFERDTFEKTR
jgi:hypothetical protein